MILNLIKKIKHKNIKWLDIGCGTSKHFEYNNNYFLNNLSNKIDYYFNNHLGHKINAILKYKNITYIGIDNSKYMLKMAKKNKFNKHKYFINYNYDNLNKLNKNFDIITSFYCSLCYTKNIEKNLKSISKILSKNGYFIFSYFNKNILENLQLNILYKDKQINYNGIWEHQNEITYYHEKIYDKRNLIYENLHQLYIIENIRNILTKYFIIIEETNYKKLLNAKDEILFILQKK